MENGEWVRGGKDKRTGVLIYRINWENPEYASKGKKVSTGNDISHDRHPSIEFRLFQQFDFL